MMRQWLRTSTLLTSIPTLLQHTVTWETHNNASGRDQKRYEEEVRVYEEMVTRFGTASASGLQELVARALVNKGITLGQLERSEEAVRIYEEVVTRFGTASAPGLQELVTAAMNGIGFEMLRRAKKNWATGD